MSDYTGDLFICSTKKVLLEKSIGHDENNLQHCGSPEYFNGCYGAQKSWFSSHLGLDIMVRHEFGTKISP